MPPRYHFTMVPGHGMKVASPTTSTLHLQYSMGKPPVQGHESQVLSAGDLALECYDFIVGGLNKPLFFVFGNHHLTDGTTTNANPDPRPPFTTERAGRCGGYLPGGPGVTGGGSWCIAPPDSAAASGTTEASTSPRISRCSSRCCVSSGPAVKQDVSGRMTGTVSSPIPRRTASTTCPTPVTRDSASSCGSCGTFRPRYLVHGRVHLYDRNASPRGRLRRRDRPRRVRPHRGTGR